MNRLLDFYGKEHKVIKLDDAQALADILAGEETVILHGDASSPISPISRGIHPTYAAHKVRRVAFRSSRDKIRHPATA